MTPFIVDFKISASATEKLSSTLTFQPPEKDSDFLTRTGMIASENKKMAVYLYSTPATQKFIYLRQAQITPTFAKLLHLPKEMVSKTIRLPGQLLLGGERSECVTQGVKDIFATKILKENITKFDQTEIAVLPILREGMKYGIAEALTHNFDYYCDEVVVDAHHVQDDSVAGFARRVDITMFKDVDMTDEQHQNIKLAIIGDSTAGGVVLVGMLEKLLSKFPRLEQVDIIAPLATLFGATRVTQHIPENLTVRLHTFETLLNAQAPDFYWSPHYADLNFHIQPEMETEYRKWWGQDSKGNWIADTACAGYGWSEAFFHPQKDIRMMNEELIKRHTLTITKITERNL